MQALGARTAVGIAALLTVLFLSSWNYLGLPPRNDSLATLWLIANTSPLEWMFDPRVAGYEFVFFFEPGYALIHYPGLWLAPLVGDPGHHVAALAGVAGLGAVAALLAFDGTRSLAAAAAASALASFSAPVWYCIADTSMSHYPFATAFGLLALRPVWRAFWATESDREFPDRVRSLASALLFGAGLCFKESVASLPAIAVALHLITFRRPVAAVAFVTPHAVVLAGFLAWHTYILGGSGGYFMLPGWVPSNWLVALPIVFYTVWGHAGVGLVVFAALAFVHPRAFGIAALTWVLGIAPFVLAAPFQLDPFSAGRLLFPLVFTVVLLTVGATRRWPRDRRGVQVALGAAVAVMLVLQVAQRPRVLDTYRRQPASPVPPPPWTEPLAVVSEEWTVPAFQHQLEPDPVLPFVSYRTPIDRALDRALGRVLPANTRVVPPSDPLPTPMLSPLSRDLAKLEFDALGRAHVRLSDEAVGRLWLALDYQNGPTRFLVSYPVHRARVDLPLARSMRRIVLFEPSPGAVWPARIFDAPAFVDPFPASRDD